MFQIQISDANGTFPKFQSVTSMLS